MLDSKEQIDLYYDHYKNTDQKIIQYLKKREKYSIFLLCILVINLFGILDAETLFNNISTLLSDRYGIRGISFSAFDSFSLVLFVFITFEYYLVCLTVERSYKYIHNVENNLSVLMEINIDRESKSYLSEYPLVTEIAHISFSYIFPLLILIISALKLIYYWNFPSSFLFYINIFFSILNCVASFVYIIDRITLAYSCRLKDVVTTIINKIKYLLLIIGITLIACYLGYKCGYMIICFLRFL